MITERQQENAALHALGLLEGAEHITFESELMSSPELQSLVASLIRASAAIALTVPQIAPPATLKASILDAVSASTTAAPVEPRPAQVVSFPLLRWVSLGVAAGLAVTAVWLGSQNFRLRQENTTLRTERELAEIAYQTAQSQLKERSLIAETMINDLGRQLSAQRDLTHLKITALAALAGNTPEAHAIAVWDPVLETGLLTVEKLPAIADNQDYQIWVVDPAYPNPVDGGVFKPGADGKAVLTFKGNQPITSVAAFAVSLEKKGGVPKAEGPILLLGKL